jgi:hypothetical protein
MVKAGVYSIDTLFHANSEAPANKYPAATTLGAGKQKFEVESFLKDKETGELLAKKKLQIVSGVELPGVMKLRDCQILLSDAQLLVFARHASTLANTNNQPEASIVLIQRTHVPLCISCRYCLSANEKA